MLADAIPPPFPGFTPEGLDFLRDLSDNNDRDWFNERKPTYVDHLKDPLDLLVADVARRLDDAGLPLTDGRPFRIYRDVRFSNDKTPYQTHVSAAFRQPESDDPVVLYVHVEPGASFVAAGVYRPLVAYLKPVRQSIADRPEWFEAVRAEVEAEGLDIGHAGTTLTGMPHGFAAYRDKDVADVLKWQSYIAQESVSDEAVQEPGFARTIVDVAVRSTPLLEFLWRVHDGGPRA